MPISKNSNVKCPLLLFVMKEFNGVQEKLERKKQHFKLGSHNVQQLFSHRILHPFYHKHVLQAYIGVGKQVGAISRYKKAMSPWIAHQIPGPGVIKLFPCSTQLSVKFILLINVKMPTLVGILTIISMINTTSERLKAINFFICRYFSFYEQLKFRAKLS